LAIASLKAAYSALMPVSSTTVAAFMASSSPWMSSMYFIVVSVISLVGTPCPDDR
jgi:hypothetical protein